MQGGGELKAPSLAGHHCQLPSFPALPYPHDQPPISLPYLQMPRTWNFILPSVKNSASPERLRGTEKKSEEI